MYLLLSEGKPVTVIAKLLHAEKRPTPSEYKRKDANPSCVWTSGGILQILREEQYTGMYIAGKTATADVGSKTVIQMDESEWVKIPNHHPAIIDKAQFNAVQSAYPKKHTNKKKEKVKPLPPYIFENISKRKATNHAEPTEQSIVAKVSLYEQFILGEITADEYKKRIVELNISRNNI